MAIKVKKITYTPADIYAMNGAPQLVLAAPAAGYANAILGISHNMVYNSAAYTVAQYLYYNIYPGNGANPFEDSYTLQFTNDISIASAKQFAANSVYSTQNALYVTTDAVAATGDSDIIAYIVYETKLLDA
jgi:hypothetical protein